MPQGVGKIIAVNRKARHDYHIIDSLEAGISLVGTEVKSIRQGGVNLKDSFWDDRETIRQSLHGFVTIRI